MLRVPKPWKPGSRLVLEIRGLKNVTGVAGSPVGVVAVPEKAKTDSLAPSRGDSTKVKKGQPKTPAQPTK